MKLTTNRKRLRSILLFMFHFLCGSALTLVVTWGFYVPWKYAYLPMVLKVESQALSILVLSVVGLVLVFTIQVLLWAGPGSGQGREDQHVS